MKSCMGFVEGVRKEYILDAWDIDVYSHFGKMNVMICKRNLIYSSKIKTSSKHQYQHRIKKAH